MLGLAEIRSFVGVPTAVVAMFAATALVGCGSTTVPGETVSLSVTRDFGGEQIKETKTVPLSAGLTAMRQLQAAAETETAYGGKFVTAIDGVKQDLAGGYDWLFYVDGIESDRGATGRRLSVDQVVQWDYHRWLNVKSGGATIGAYPRPLSTRGTRIECLPARSGECTKLRERFTADQIATDGSRDGRAVRVIAGVWSEIKKLAGVPDLQQNAADGGAFARFIGSGNELGLELVDDDGERARVLGTGAGLAAAFAQGDDVTWLFTGVDRDGVAAAIDLLGSPTVAGRFALAVDADGPIALPVARGAAR
ncbi:MAG: DUF4430 domain-containing protein [Solirubrobacterales bacterium]